jgi:hypothetical protein
MLESAPCGAAHGDLVAFVTKLCYLLRDRTPAVTMVKDCWRVSCYVGHIQSLFYPCLLLPRAAPSFLRPLSTHHTQHGAGSRTRRPFRY